PPVSGRSGYCAPAAPCRRLLASWSRSMLAALEDRRRFKRMVGRGRRYCPFQALRTVPDLRVHLFAALACLEHDVEEEQLRDTEAEGTDRRDHVELGKLQRIVGYAARHAGETKEVLHEEGHVEEDQGQPE